MQRFFNITLIILALVSGYSYLSNQANEAKEFKTLIESDFPKASIITTHGDTVLDYQVMFDREAFPNETQFLNFFSKNNQALFKLAETLNLMQTSVNFGIPGEGFLYRMNCFDQGYGQCHIGRGTLPNFKSLESVCYKECVGNITN